MKFLQNISLRVLAVFTMNALGVIGAGAIAGIPLWKAALMAGIGGVATVVAKLIACFLEPKQTATNLVIAQAQHLQNLPLSQEN